MLKYPKTIEKTGKSVEEAVEAAIAELNVACDEVEVTVIDEGAKGFLGLGAKDAIVKVSVKSSYENAAREFLSSVFEAMKLDVNIDIKNSDDAMDIELSGEHMGIIIGKRGDTLDSLQYLTSLVINSKSDDYKKVNLDTENYREKRNVALVALAERLSKKVEKTGKKYTLEPMNPYERRIIHSTLQGNEAITTFSIGEDPYRKVVIAPKDGQARPQKRRNSDFSKPRRKLENTENTAPAEPKAPSAAEAAFIDYANYAKERAMRPKEVKQKAGSFDEYLASQENENSENE